METNSSSNIPPRGCVHPSGSVAARKSHDHPPTSTAHTMRDSPLIDYVVYYIHEGAAAQFGAVKTRIALPPQGD